MKAGCSLPKPSWKPNPEQENISGLEVLSAKDVLGYSGKAHFLRNHAPGVYLGNNHIFRTAASPGLVPWDQILLHKKGESGRERKLKLHQPQQRNINFGAARYEFPGFIKMS